MPAPEAAPSLFSGRVFFTRMLLVTLCVFDYLLIISTLISNTLILILNLPPFQGELPSLVIDDEHTVFWGSRFCVSLETADASKNLMCILKDKIKVIFTL